MDTSDDPDLEVPADIPHEAPDVLAGDEVVVNPEVDVLEPPVTSDPPPTWTCKHCSEIFSGHGHNAINFERHEGTCKSNPANQRKRKSTGAGAGAGATGQKLKVAKSHSIRKFFTAAAALPEVEESAPSCSVVGDPSPSPDCVLPGIEDPLVPDAPLLSSGLSGVDQSLTSLTNEIHDIDNDTHATLGEIHDIDNDDTHATLGEIHDIDNDDTHATQNSDLPVNTVSVSVGVRTPPQQKCTGFVPALVGRIYENFPFQLLDSGPLKGVVFENGAFHWVSCLNNMYILPFSCDTDAENVHPDCKKLHIHEKLGDYVTHANDANKHLTTAKNISLTYNQLTRRVGHLQSSLNSSRLNSLNKDRKLVRLHKSLELHQRFMMLIKENSIPKLHELVKVACNRKRGLEYTITTMVNAIDGIYNARSGEDDKDLAFLILQYGGPGLLDIVHRALNFPSTSTAYRLLQSSRHFIKSSVNTDLEDFVNNIVVSPDLPKYGYMLKVDETYLEPKVRWNPKDNKLYGICYEHGRHHDLTFDSYDHVESLADMVRTGDLCVPKETMVIACSNNSVDAKAQVVAALPTCSKSEVDFQSQLIQEISYRFVKIYGTPLMNWSTDGDATRRILFDELMSHDLSPLSPIYDTIKQLRLLDRKVGKNDETVNFDHKHIVKRMRKCLINDNFKIGDRVLMKSDMEKIISLVPNNTEYSNQKLLNPDDKMNVPLATAFLHQFCDAVEDVEKLKTVSMRVGDVAEELHLFKYVIEGVLAGYTNPSTTIEDQLEKISLAAHILFVLQRELKTFVTNQLYHDIQATFMDAFYCASKYKEYHPDLPLFIMLCANDVLERFFGNLRLKYKNSIVDNLELIFATRALQLCADMMTKHPKWFAKNRNVMQRLCLDYSSPKEWNMENLILKDVDIVSTWNVGRASAELKLGACKKYKSKCDFFAISEEGHTLLIPNGTKLGLNPREKDFSIEEDVATVADQNDVQEVGDSAVDDAQPIHGGDIEDTPATSLIDMIPQDNNQKHDVQIEIDNKHVYKATVVKNMFCSEPMSRDRLRRVRGMTKYTDSTTEGEHTIETSVLAGDPVLIEVQGILRIAQIQLIKRANRKVKLIKADEIHNANVYIEALLMKVNTFDDLYYWSGSFGEKVSALGTACYAIQPTLKEIEGKLTFTFDKQFIIDYNVGMTLEAQRTGTSSTSSSSVVVSPSSAGPSRSSSATANNQSGSGKEKAADDKGEKLKLMIPCLICKVKVQLGQMRKHVGIHIVNGVVSGCNVCGFCGRDVCTNTLAAGAKNSSGQFFRTSTNCNYDSFIQRKPVHSTRNQCSNHLVPCPVCKVAIWTYNAKCHYEAIHPDVEYNDSQFVTAAERTVMAGLAKKAKR